LFSLNSIYRGYEKQCKMWKLVVWGYGSPKVIANTTIHYCTYDFVFNFNKKKLCYASILYHFRVIASYLSKVADFNVPHPFTGDSDQNFVTIFGIRKLRLPGLSCGIVCVTMCSHSDTTPACDRHTQTQNDSTYCASIATHGKNHIHNQKSMEYTTTTPDTGTPCHHVCHHCL